MPRFIRIFFGVLISAIFIAVVVLALIMGATGKRHCEHDATDRTVSDSYCRGKVPGYTWETD